MDKPMNSSMDSTDSPDSKDSETSQETNSEYNPFDSVISTIDSYIKNPRLVTPQTLTDLKSEVEQIKTSYESDETGDTTDETPTKDSSPSLTVMIGKMKHGGMGK